MDQNIIRKKGYFAKLFACFCHHNVEPISPVSMVDSSSVETKSVELYTESIATSNIPPFHCLRCYRIWDTKSNFKHHKCHSVENSKVDHFKLFETSVPNRRCNILLRSGERDGNPCLRLKPCLYHKECPRPKGTIMMNADKTGWTFIFNHQIVNTPAG
jgi:hypothetical protein